MIGRQLGDYTVRDELGSGGMGTVYLADGPEGQVALKVLHAHMLAEPGFFRRFRREVEIGCAVRHENVVRTLRADAVVVDGVQHHFMVMEYVEGQTLRSLLREMERVPEELCRHIGREVAKGLAAIHAVGAVHRDIKPGNVLITPDHVVKIMDLGVARLRDEAHSLSQSGEVVGTLRYAAPEQLKGDPPVPATDFYSLGLVLYELSTGRPAFTGDDLVQVVQDRLELTPRPVAEINPQLSPFFEEVVKALLQRDPAERLDYLPADEDSTWWGRRARQLRADTRRPLRRVRIPRETSLYGRERDLARLRSLFERASAGSGQVVLLEGEAGIGKTRLVDELVGRLQADGADLNFLFGSYPPGGAATATRAWSTAYREHFGADGLSETLSRYLPATPVLVPAFAALLLGEPTPEGSEALTKDSYQTVFVHATRALAAERPTVVVIEDLHFAPEEGRALLAALALAVPEHRVLLIGTTRPGLPDEWVSSLDRLDHVHHLGLERLGPKDLSKLLVDAFHSKRLAEELAFRIAAKSDGNPFFVFEIIRGLREGKLIARRPDGTWMSTQAIREIAIPSTVRELVQARIAGLDDADREILDVAACCGFEFDPLLVGEVLGLPDVPLLRRLGRLEHPHRIVRSAGLRYVFDHHQVQEALYEAQSELLRRRYHAAIAEALERRRGAEEVRGAPAVDLCSHYLRGDRGAEGARYLDAALEHLGRCYRNDEAVALADLALKEHAGLLEGAARVKVLLQKVERLDLLGWRAQHESTLEEALALAREIGDLGLRGRVHRALAWFHITQARIDAGERECRRARDLCRQAGDRKGEAVATAMLGTTLWTLARYEEARDHFERHLTITREIGDRKNEAKTAGNLGLVFHDLGEDDKAREYVELHLAISREVGYRQGEANATGNLGIIAWSQGRYEEARERFGNQLAIAQEIGHRQGVARSAGNLGLVFHDLGRYEEAREHYLRQLPLTREIGDVRGEAICNVNLGALLIKLGAPGPAKERLEESLRLSRAIGARHPEGFALHSLAGVAEDAESAKGLLEEALVLRTEIRYRSGILSTRTALGRVWIALGGHEEARAQLEEALEIARQLESRGAEVLALALLAQLPGSDPAPFLEALPAHGDALEPHARMEVRFLAWKVTGEIAHLEEAHRLLRGLRDHAPREFRDSLVERVELHRAVSRACRDHGVC